MVAYIDRAGAEGAELIVFPEFILGTFFENTNTMVEAVAQAADKNNIHVVAGGMEEYKKGAFQTLEKDAFANTALLFGRDGRIIGKYNKNHRANSRTHHQRRPEVYGEIAESHKPWFMYKGESELVANEKTF